MPFAIELAAAYHLDTPDLPLEYTSGRIISKLCSAFDVGFYGASVFAMLCMGIVIRLISVMRTRADLFMRRGTLERLRSTL